MGALPVVDDQRRVVGVVTVSDVLRDYAYEDGLKPGTASGAEAQA